MRAKKPWPAFFSGGTHEGISRGNRMEQASAADNLIAFGPALSSGHKSQRVFLDFSVCPARCIDTSKEKKQMNEETIPHRHVISIVCAFISSRVTQSAVRC